MYSRTGTDTSPTVPVSRARPNPVYTLTYSYNDSTTATSDPWQRSQTESTATITTYVNYALPRAEVDYAEIRREARRAACLVAAPVENRAHTRVHARARRGFQQMARLPCYRATRTR